MSEESFVPPGTRALCTEMSALLAAGQGPGWRALWLCRAVWEAKGTQAGRGLEGEARPASGLERPEFKDWPPCLLSVQLLDGAPRPSGPWFPHLQIGTPSPCRFDGAHGASSASE